MFKKPTCRKCGTDHYNFLRCAEAVEIAQTEEKRSEEQNAPTIWRHREGMHEWGDRLDSFDRSGSTFWRRRED